MQLIRRKKGKSKLNLQTKKKSFLHIAHTDSHSLPFSPISLISRRHACSFVCCEGSKSVFMFNNGKNIFMQTFTGLCEGFIKKTRRCKLQLYSTLFSEQDKNLLLLFHFLFSQCSSAYIASARKLPIPEGASNSKQNPAGCRAIDIKL